jgi:hypothetical protein
MAGPYEHGTKPWDLITSDGFCDELNDYKLLKDSVLWN